MSYSDTPEQAAVIAWKGERLVVSAFAGTGKTSTLRRYADENPTERMLYVAYNRAIRDEAEQKFPFNVTCKTSHQLAWPTVGRHYSHRLVNTLRLTDVARALNSRNWLLSRLVLDVINRFMCSASPQISIEHAPESDDCKGIEPAQILLSAQKIWDMMISRQGDFPVTHDTYLKLYQLSNPNLSSRYTTVLFDEAQDANPVTSALVLRQACRVVLVGDTHQQIYRFRGADNAMQAPQLENADRLWLTHSFRFGPEVAQVANRLLALKGETHQVTGKGGPDRVLQTQPRTFGHHAVLHRSVCGVIRTALHWSLAGKKVFWVGGMESYKIEDLLDLYWFSIDMTERIRHDRLTREYRDYDEYLQIAEDTGDIEMKQAIFILEQFFPLPDRLNTLREQRVSMEAEADITVCTAHRSKGLEWDRVRLHDDFADILDPDMPESKRNDEINLLYVAATRARHTLITDPVLSELLAQPSAGELLPLSGEGNASSEIAEDENDVA
ncbi:UvrD-helicase domain-containing protein [Salmonella enterica]|uniref:DNA 3'-5' helicase n=2 Tax=Salmonella enterica TaxID=28901 RepID=A0A379QIS4_SALER|nr:UvrD-helicase domain-containing protein [Salmonella enterica]ECC1657508.1 ATP-dependent helicase [Salmonella enterica subsp. salamae]ASG86863.1 DNA helicase [Salmonella enterica subsp. salamae serovar 55:k:z39 str. 1315K]ECD9415749.1 ATP-dependent helicase [Salmonella enterica subsp. salamae]ECF5932688.1 ATP-dependent helicase [Salmonella enterica subsp. salamae]ECG1251442.1 ATP-dependent helicase [Salmonella enterica subsp. salamae]